MNNHEPKMTYKVFKYPNYAFVYTVAEKGYTFYYKMIPEDISLCTLYFKGSMLMTDCDDKSLIGTVFTGFFDWRLRPELNTQGIKETCLVTEHLEKLCLHPKPLINEINGVKSIENLGVKNVEHFNLKNKKLTIPANTDVIIADGYIISINGTKTEAKLSEDILPRIPALSRPYEITVNGQILLISL